MENAPEGTLRIGKSKGFPQYYHYIIGAEHDGTYLSKKDIEFARQLAQKSYNEKVLRYAKKTHMQITRLLQNYQDEKLEQIYYAEHKERQKLIVPVEETYEQKLARWMSQPFTGKGFAEGAATIMTNSGVRVRSKSEKIMADYFDSIGLQYKYECPLQLKKQFTVYPDFTFLSKKTGKEIYWEHDGMMDSQDYAQSAVKKIESYENSGIFPGERLILTFETSTTVLNMEIVKRLTHKYLI